MSGSWVAGTVRARSLSHRCLGRDGARRVAASATLSDAVDMLADTAYGHDVRPGQTLEQAERAVAASLLWHLRVLAGWQPAQGVVLVRLLAGWFEAANIDEHVRRLLGRAGSATLFDLGSLDTAWRRLAATTSLAEVRRVLTASPWGDPGMDTADRIAVGIRVSWAVRVAKGAPTAADWAGAGAALVVAREKFLAGRGLTEPVAQRVRALLGTPALAATSLAEFALALPRRLRWSLIDVTTPAGLWQAENRWWERVERDGFELSHQPRFSSSAVAGTVALLAADARRVRAALELAARGGAPIEAFDALA